MAELPPGTDLHTIPVLRPPNGIISDFENPPSIADTATAVVSLVIVLEIFFLSVRLHSNISKFRTLAADDCMLNRDRIFLGRPADSIQGWLLLRLFFHLALPFAFYIVGLRYSSLSASLCSIASTVRSFARHFWNVSVAMVTIEMKKVCPFLVR